VSSRSKAVPLVIALFALLLCAGPAAAETYTVTRTDDPVPGACEPADCSLREALMAANGTTAVDDIVVVPASASPYLLQYEMLYLPISDEVEVRGAGADKTVVKGNGEESIFGTFSNRSVLSGLTIAGGQAAIQNSSGELIVRGVSIEGNRWNGGTAGIISNGPVTVESSFLGFNRTENVSGGVIFANAPVTVVNSTIAHNTSEKGLGAISGNSSVTLVNSAVVSNRSEAASMAAVGGTPLTVRNSVFADNRDAGGLLNCISTGPLTSFGGNVSDDGSCGAGGGDKPNVNPLLGPLELHGGTTRVFSLLAGSPAIDAAQQCPAVDQRGVPRPQGSPCDSGPYEFAAPPSPPPGDSEFAMKVGKKLRLTKKRVIRVPLTCPASEVSPPCRGRVRIGNLPLRFDGPHTLQMRFLSARFSIPAGKTKAVAVKSPRSTRIHLPTERGTWKVLLRVAAEDAAGNKWEVRKKRARLIRR